jgi:hypothetical protein
MLRLAPKLLNFMELTQFRGGGSQDDNEYFMSEEQPNVQANDLKVKEYLYTALCHLSY